MAKSIGLLQKGFKGYLVEEDVFSVATLSRKVFQISILADAMFLAELLPELTTN